MIQVIKHGAYQLNEADNSYKIIILDNSKFLSWNPLSGEIIDSTKSKPQSNSTLSIGKYFLYNVENEKELTNCLHLELLLGKRKWQAYVLPLGLPTKKQKNTKIIPTTEVITMSRFIERN